MECVSLQESFCIWLSQYGNFALFGLLALGIIALPVPEETLMVLAGAMMAQNGVEPIPTMIAAYGGAICGITMSYLVGRSAGSYLIHRFGSKVGLTEERLALVHDWFERFGKWSLCFGYFVPGVRHFTGFVAGTTALHYGAFALFAYMGAVAWVSTFLACGYFLGEHGLAVFHILEGYTDEVMTVAIIIICIYLWITVRKFLIKRS